MKTEDVQVGSTITNGSSALRITERVQKDTRWGTIGWRGIHVSLEEFGGMTGTTGFIADYLLGSWDHVPFEWRALPGGGVEERYVWTPGYRHLQREVRRVPGGAPADHPHTDPGDGRTECERCGKFVWLVTHSCKGVPVTEAARQRAGVMPTVDGIRGHRIITAEEDEAMRQAAQATLRDTPVFPHKACDEADDHDPHVWQERHIPTGNPLVWHSQWWQCGEEDR